MATKPLPCPTLLRLILRYDSETGKLFWRKRSRAFFTNDQACASWNTRWAEKPAFTAPHGPGGYLVGNACGRLIMAHRAAWAIAHGQWPAELLDHINGVPSDNRLSNLREATSLENCWNTRSKSRVSKFKGVAHDRRDNRWSASIKVGAKSIYLGRFATDKEAARAYDAEALKHFGEFARTNFGQGIPS